MAPADASTLWRVGLPILWMGGIFFLSSQPSLTTDLGTVDLILRKLAHMVEFGVLALLWAWALRDVVSRPALLAVAIAVVYAVTDELHQTRVEGRNGTPIDVLIDAIGACLATWAASRYDRLRPVIAAREDR